MQMTTEAVWEAFSTQLRRYIRRQVRDESATDDILQEVFLRVYTHGATVQGGDKITGWLYQVTRNAIIDHYRKGHGNRVTPLPADAAECYAATEPDRAASVQALLPCVRAMVKVLPEPYREALLLTEYDGLTQKALSARLGMSISGAKTRVQRAREKLRTLLLACCHLEFDHAGRVMDYHPNCACCAVGPCSVEEAASVCEATPCGMLSCVEG